MESQNGRKVVHMKKFFILTETHTKLIYKLMRDGIDKQFIFLNRGPMFSDIAQYSQKFGSVKVLTVKTADLNLNNELMIRRG